MPFTIGKSALTLPVAAAIMLFTAALALPGNAATPLDAWQESYNGQIHSFHETPKGVRLFVEAPVDRRWREDRALGLTDLMDAMPEMHNVNEDVIPKDAKGDFDKDDLVYFDIPAGARYTVDSKGSDDLIRKGAFVEIYNAKLIGQELHFEDAIVVIDSSLGEKANAQTPRLFNWRPVPLFQSGFIEDGTEDNREYHVRGYIVNVAPLQIALPRQGRLTPVTLQRGKGSKVSIDFYGDDFSLLNPGQSIRIKVNYLASFEGRAADLAQYAANFNAAMRQAVLDAPKRRPAMIEKWKDGQLVGRENVTVAPKNTPGTKRRRFDNGVTANVVKDGDRGPSRLEERINSKIQYYFSVNAVELSVDVVDAKMLDGWKAVK